MYKLINLSSLIKQSEIPLPPTPLTLKYHFGSDGQNSGGQFWYSLVVYIMWLIGFCV